jgi:G3E family GTPase
MAVPVHIFSGFLGAGKTTAIRAQLDERGDERVAVIVNDFGEASLDAAALDASEPFRITNIPGGCVCCTAPEGFVDALGAVLAEQPDRVIIEPTGLARPQDLIDTIRRCAHREALEPRPVVVLVDPRQLPADEADDETAQLLREQAGVADVFVANRTDLCEATDLERFRALAAALWPAPLSIHETVRGALPKEVMEWPPGEGPRAERAASGEHPAHSTAGFRARSFKWSSNVVFSRARLESMLARCVSGAAGAPPARFKGIFRTLEGTSRFEIAGGELHHEVAAFRRDSRADAIVEAAHDAALDAIAGGLAEAILRDDELALDVNRVEIVLPDGRLYGVDRDRLLALPDGIEDVSERFPKREGAAARVAALFAALDLPRAGEAIVVAGDGFASEPVALSVLCEGVILHSQGGEPLPEGQGGPFRLLIPEDASDAPVSCANVKGVAKIVIRD